MFLVICAYVAAFEGQYLFTQIESEQEMEERIENLKGKLVARVNTCTCLQHDYNKLLELVRVWNK